MTILDTLPALPWRYEPEWAGQWMATVLDADGKLIAKVNSLRQAQALVSLVNSAAAMREALGPFAAVAEALDEAGRQGGGNFSAWVNKLQPIDFGQARAALALIEEGK